MHASGGPQDDDSIPPESLTDEELFLRAQAADRLARELLYKRYLAPLVRRARAKVGDWDAAVDIAHDALLTAERNFDPGRGSFAQRVEHKFGCRLIDHYRRCGRRGRLLSTSDIDSCAEPAHEPMTQVELTMHAAALHSEALQHISELTSPIVRARRRCVLDAMFAGTGVPGVPAVAPEDKDIAASFGCTTSQITRDRAWIRERIGGAPR